MRPTALGRPGSETTGGVSAPFHTSVVWRVVFQGGFEQTFELGDGFNGTGDLLVVRSGSA